jgi:hypothetical protein
VGHHPSNGDCIGGVFASGAQHAWGCVTPAFLAPNKSPNKSCVFSKLFC